MQFTFEDDSEDKPTHAMRFTFDDEAGDPPTHAMQFTFEDAEDPPTHAMRFNVEGDAGDPPTQALRRPQAPCALVDEQFAKVQVDVAAASECISSCVALLDEIYQGPALDPHACPFCGTWSTSRSGMVCHATQHCARKPHKKVGNSIGDLHGLMCLANPV